GLFPLDVGDVRFVVGNVRFVVGDVRKKVGKIRFSTEIQTFSALPFCRELVVGDVRCARKFVVGNVRRLVRFLSSVKYGATTKIRFRRPGWKAGSRSRRDSASAGRP